MSFVWDSEVFALQEGEPCESSSEDESGTQGYQSLNSVVDVEDLGNIMNPMRREKVLFLWGMLRLDPVVHSAPRLVQHRSGLKEQGLISLAPAWKGFWFCCLSFLFCCIYMNFEHYKLHLFHVCVLCVLCVCRSTWAQPEDSICEWVLSVLPPCRSSQVDSSYQACGKRIYLLSHLSGLSVDFAKVFLFSSVKTGSLGDK